MQQAKAIVMTKLLRDSGVAGCLSVVPYYNKPTQEGMFQHLKPLPNVQIYHNFFIMCRVVPVVI